MPIHQLKTTLDFYLHYFCCKKEGICLLATRLLVSQLSKCFQSLKMGVVNKMAKISWCHVCKTPYIKAECHTHPCVDFLKYIVGVQCYCPNNYGFYYRCRIESEIDTLGHCWQRGWNYQIILRASCGSTFVLNQMAAGHQCGYDVGLPVQKASQCAEMGGGRRQVEGHHVSFFYDTEARTENDRKLYFPWYPLAGRVEQVFHLLIFPCLPLFYPHSHFIYLTQLGQLRPPQAAEMIMYRTT